MDNDTTQANQPIRIMLVEDEALQRKIAQCVLERDGKAKVVAQAATGEAALQMYRNARPDVVFMDIHMPGAGGFAATSRIIAEDPGARIVIWSCDAGDVAVRRAREAGAVGFVDKLGRHNNLCKAADLVFRGEAFYSPGLIVPHDLGPPDQNANPLHQVLDRRNCAAGLIVRERPRSAPSVRAGFAACSFPASMFGLHLQRDRTNPESV